MLWYEFGTINSKICLIKIKGILCFTQLMKTS